VATGCTVLVRYDLRLQESMGIYEFAVRTHLRVPTPFVIIPYDLILVPKGLIGLRESYDSRSTVLNSHIQ